MQKMFWTDHRGLTLIEVMIALAVFSVGILAVSSMQCVSMNGIARAKTAMLDSVAASGQIERILSLPYDDPRLVDIDNGYFPDSPDHGPITVPFTGSVMEWEVQDNFPVPGTKRISVTIRRAGRAGSGHISTYQYVKSKDFNS